jgi:hypothetical protein
LLPLQAQSVEQNLPPCIPPVIASEAKQSSLAVPQQEDDP